MRTARSYFDISAMKFELVVTPRARADILRNAIWWAENHSPDQAIAWFDAMYDQLETLRVMPERFPLAPENDLVDVDLHEMPLGVGNRPSYRAIFTVKVSEVHVLTVRRGAQGKLTPADLE